MKFAFLFDIDGCLTLPDNHRSILDVALIDEITGLSCPKAFITGRSDGWLRQQYTTLNRSSYLAIPTYIEFGLVYLDNGELEFQQAGTEFLPIRRKLISQLAAKAESCGIYFEPDQWYNDYPDHGSMWIEQKHIQLSIATNTDVSVKQVHQLTQNAWSELDDARVLYHHLGVDVIPSGWSKAEATAHFVQNLDESAFEWYVFGDNTSDEEMMKGLSSATFISTTANASATVRTTLQNLGVLTT